jgi:hypothetical protein
MFKRKKSLYLAIIFIISFLSCKKDGGTDSSSISSPFTVKYEFTADKSLDQVLPKPIIAYINSSGGTTQTTGSSLPWVLEQTVTATNRPFNLQMTGLIIYLTGPGSVTGNIYINGVKKATATGQTRAFLGSNVVNQLQVVYTVN